MKSDADTLFQAGGDMAAKEWAETPLGLPSSWPQSLRAIVRVMLTSRYAMWQENSRRGHMFFPVLIRLRYCCN